MKLQGITIDFNDIKSCGILPDMCVDFDQRSDELSENENLLAYWDNRLENLMKETKDLVIVNDENKSLVYSANEKAIDLIKKHFKELELSSIDYEEIHKCDFCVQHDYLK